MPALKYSSVKKIKLLLDDLLNNHIGRALINPNNHSGNPFVLALFKQFEPLIHRIHGMKTSLGNQLEKIAEIIALQSVSEEYVQRNLNVNITLPRNVFAEIDRIINELSNAQNLSDYQREKDLVILACRNPSAESESHTYEFDLIITNPNTNHKVIIEMKGPDPNTTEVPGAKKRLLVGLAWLYLQGHRNIDCKLGIYYNNKNPRPYRNAKVLAYFNPNGGILTQENFWNFLGSNDNIYPELIRFFNLYGEKNKRRILDSFQNLIQE